MIQVYGERRQVSSGRNSEGTKKTHLIWMNKRMHTKMNRNEHIFGGLGVSQEVESLMCVFNELQITIFNRNSSCWHD